MNQSTPVNRPVEERLAELKEFLDDALDEGELARSSRDFGRGVAFVAGHVRRIMQMEEVKNP